jgi:outer membrane scaffolding protein for murein synthesis (MipA/OmpV family)
MRKLILSLLYALLFLSQPLCAKIKGKVDIGPVLVDLDILESGRTIDTQHMKGVRGDATVIFWRGIFLKPSYTWANGDGRLSAGGIGIGQYIPFNDKFTVMGSVGVSFSSIRSKIDLEAFALSDVTQKFRSTSPYVCLEFTYLFAEKWTLMGTVQYAWSHTQTVIKHVFSDKGHSVGPNYSLGIDYSINKNWSVTFAGGYNISLSHEKHGIRAKGLKLGLAYYF